MGTRVGHQRFTVTVTFSNHLILLLQRTATMDLSSLPPVVKSFLRIAQTATRFDNEALWSLLLRTFLGFISYCFFYTKLAGLLLNALAYLVAHRWYVLSMTCSIVVLIASAAMLELLQWLFNWRGRLLAAYRHGRILNVEQDYLDDESVMAWAKTIGRLVVVSSIWTIYCYVNVRLDYALFWHQYSVGNPAFNLELLLVNSLQAGPILLGAAYTIHRMNPSLYESISRTHLTASLTSHAAADEHMQTLLS